MAAGCTACLAKPVDIDQLLVTVAALVGGTRVDQALNKPAVLPIRPVDKKSLPQTPIVSRLAGNTRLQSAIDKFLARLDGQLGAIEQAWQARDFGALANLAHWLKGAGGTVGFDSFNEPARKLEQMSRANLADGMEEVLMELKDIAARIVRPQVAASTPPPAPDQTRANP
jgi:HPt (histidine-containing phosphotransfer) domain-containing protein